MEKNIWFFFFFLSYVQVTACHPLLILNPCAVDKFANAFFLLTVKN